MQNITQEMIIEQEQEQEIVEQKHEIVEQVIEETNSVVSVIIVPEQTNIKYECDICTKKLNG